VLTNYLIRLAVEKRGEEYWSFPQRNLFDKIGIRSMVMETDPYGNFLTQGYELMSGRDWARLGNLYLQDGVWNGQRILPEGFTTSVSTVAPAWAADKQPIYGGFFWINGDAGFPVPKDAYYMSGAGGQTVLIIPSHDLVVVRIGHYKGGKTGKAAFARRWPSSWRPCQPRRPWSNAIYAAGMEDPNAQGSTGASTVTDAGRSPHRASRLLDHPSIGDDGCAFIVVHRLIFATVYDHGRRSANAITRPSSSTCTRRSVGGSFAREKWVRDPQESRDRRLKAGAHAAGVHGGQAAWLYLASGAVLWRMRDRSLICRDRLCRTGGHVRR
jgi:hypothetical protein